MELMELQWIHTAKGVIQPRTTPLAETTLSLMRFVSNVNHYRDKDPNHRSHP